jgi:hypothetical protein
MLVSKVDRNVPRKVSIRKITSNHEVKRNVLYIMENLWHRNHFE